MIENRVSVTQERYEEEAEGFTIKRETGKRESVRERESMRENEGESEKDSERE